MVKFGGSSLADHEKILRAVTAVANEAKKGTQITVIVSAMGKTTDVLFNAAKGSSNGNLHKQRFRRNSRNGRTHQHQNHGRCPESPRSHGTLCRPP